MGSRGDEYVTGSRGDIMAFPVTPYSSKSRTTIQTKGFLIKIQRVADLCNNLMTSCFVVGIKSLVFMRCFGAIVVLYVLRGKKKKVYTFVVKPS